MRAFFDSYFTMIGSLIALVFIIKHPWFLLVFPIFVIGVCLYAALFPSPEHVAVIRGINLKYLHDRKQLLLEVEAHLEDMKATPTSEWGSEKQKAKAIGSFQKVYEEQIAEYYEMVMLFR